MRSALGLVLAAVLLVTAPAAHAQRADVAALQVALRATGDYRGTVDGVRGPMTAAAIRRFQSRRGLVADGIVGPVTRRALGRRGRPRLGSRVLHQGQRGWDVAALQFLLGRHGFPSGSMDGGLGPRTDGALRRFQAWSGLGADGLAGPATLGRLHSAPPASPLIFAPPLAIGVHGRLRAARRPLPHRDRLPGRRRHARRRGRPRLRLVRGLGPGRLRQPRDRVAPPRDDVLLRPPLLVRGAARAVRRGRQPHRPRRLHGQLHRPAPALRAAAARRGGPAALRLAGPS